MAVTASDRIVMVWRGLARRCPRCAAGGLFTRWTEMASVCPRCELEFSREEGYWLGAVTLNIVATELVFAVALLVAVILTWPEMPVLPLVALGIALNVGFAIFFYPSSKTLWVAVDLSLFHPLKPWRRRKSESLG